MSRIDEAKALAATLAGSPAAEMILHLVQCAEKLERDIFVAEHEVTSAHEFIDSMAGVIG